MRNSETQTKNKVENPKKNEQIKKNDNSFTDNLTKQFLLLQQTVGNQKIMEMMQAGILPNSMPKSTQQELTKTGQDRAAIEARQINKDRESLLPEIMRKLSDKKDQLEQLKNQKPGVPVYANVDLELEYVEIPGENKMVFYHYTELRKVDLSYKDTNIKNEPRQKNRGFTLSTTFSFLYDKNEKNIADKQEPAKIENEKETPEAKNNEKTVDNANNNTNNKS